MSRWVLGANEMSIVIIRIHSHLAVAKRDLKAKWLESNRKTRRAGEDLRKTSWRNGIISWRLDFAAGS